jgi:hypothetical protein
MEEGIDHEVPDPAADEGEGSTRREFLGGVSRALVALAGIELVSVVPALTGCDEGDGSGYGDGGDGGDCTCIACTGGPESSGCVPGYAM